MIQEMIRVGKCLRSQIQETHETAKDPRHYNHFTNSCGLLPSPSKPNAPVITRGGGGQSEQREVTNSHQLSGHGALRTER